MSALKDVINNIILYNRTGDELYNRIFVVSAFSGVTNLLLEDKKTGKPGVYHKLANFQDYHQPLKKLIARLKEINKSYASLGLNVSIADEYIEYHVKKAAGYLDNLSNILASGYVNKEG